MRPKELADAAEIPIDSYRKYEGDSAIPGGGALAGLVRAGVRVEWVLTGAELMKPVTASVREPAAAPYVITASEAARVIAALKREVGFEPGPDWTGLLIGLMADHGLRPSGAREVLAHLASFQESTRNSAA